MPWVVLVLLKHGFVSYLAFSIVSCLIFIHVKSWKLWMLLRFNSLLISFNKHYF